MLQKNQIYVENMTIVIAIRNLISLILVLVEGIIILGESKGLIMA